MARLGKKATASAAAGSAWPPDLRLMLRTSPRGRGGDPEWKQAHRGWIGLGPENPGRVSPGERTPSGPGCGPCGIVTGHPARKPEGGEGGRPGRSGCPRSGPVLRCAAAAVIRHQSALQQNVPAGAAGDGCSRGCGRACCGSPRTPGARMLEALVAEGTHEECGAAPVWFPGPPPELDFSLTGA
ncbi:hypothetical protein NDU88_005122 [Pleurodeles waltl]|uniref:Uncharacterized protein n=1 Tax=Pleurodeles waltl TaxID=8319 RepID=A0AAV7UIA4_PLEWA|nr:hypothetical protein NDU88_005122 [Pleurodeles waltl]